MDFFHPILLLFATRYLINTKLSEILLYFLIFESICMSFQLWMLIIICIDICIDKCIDICIDICALKWWCLDHVLFCHVRIHTVLLIHPELIAAQWISKNTRNISFTFSLPASSRYIMRSNYVMMSLALIVSHPFYFLL